MLSETATLTRLRTRYQEDSALVRQTFERTGDGSAAIRRRAQIVGRPPLQGFQHRGVDAQEEWLALGHQ